MRILISLAIALLAKAVDAQDNQATSNSANLELPKIQVTPLKDSQNGRAYDLYIKLPESYSENKATSYPVIYYTDVMWHIEMLSGATEYLLEEAILVGISWQTDIDEQLRLEMGDHVSRFRDYTVQPTVNVEHQKKYQFGQASQHLNFIQNNVIPFVEKNYRTDPDNNTYFGYSLGGLFGAYILLAQPDNFKNYILGSPSLEGDLLYLTQLSADGSSPNFNANIFISYGDKEEKLGKLAEDFVTLLNDKNDTSLSLTHEVIEGTHQTAFPLTVVNSITWLANLMKE